MHPASTTPAQVRSGGCEAPPGKGPSLWTRQTPFPGHVQTKHADRALCVRKELRSLSDEAFGLFVTGLATMLSVNTEAGQVCGDAFFAMHARPGAVWKL